MPRVRFLFCVCAAALTALVFVAPAPAQVDPNSGIDFVRVRAPGNAAWQGGPIVGDAAIGRGGVNYEYSIGRFEVTTAQWSEFFNAVFDRATPLNIPFIQTPPSFAWGAVPTTPTSPGGFRWNVPAGHEMYAVGGINWRTAAIYCNWLNNNKSTDPSAFTNGAYNVSTFGNLGQTFTDQVTHNANARYWIPTWDEQLKAFHFDPNRGGPGEAGYWLSVNRHDALPTSGPPPSMGGNGEVNGPWNPATYPTVSTFAIPLGAYTEQQSPWGLFDTGGATSEWTESPLDTVGFYTHRVVDGSSWVQDPVDLDSIARRSEDYPNVGSYTYGLRVASSVPAPSSGMLTFLVSAIFVRARRRRPTNASMLDHCRVNGNDRDRPGRLRTKHRQ